MKSWQSCVSSDRNPLGKGRNAQPITRISGLPNCDLFDSLPYFKDDMASMEHPVFSLTTHIDKRLLRYEHNGNTLTIKPGYDGLPTIHDKDILIYVASHLRAAMNEGRAPSRTVRFTAHDFFTSIGRSVSGDSYERFRESLRRLKGTQIETNIKTGRYRIEEGFGLIDVWRAVKEDATGRVIAVDVAACKQNGMGLQTRDRLRPHSLQTGRALDPHSLQIDPHSVQRACKQ